MYNEDEQGARLLVLAFRVSIRRLGVDVLRKGVCSVSTKPQPQNRKTKPETLTGHLRLLADTLLGAISSEAWSCVAGSCFLTQVFRVARHLPSAATKTPRLSGISLPT